MTALVQSSIARWVVAGAGALAGAGLFVSVFRARPAEPPLSPGPVQVVELTKITRGSSPLAEETMMRDLAPLFLPTERNASLDRLPVREPGMRFLDVAAPKLGMADSGWKFDRHLPPVVSLEGRPLAEVTPVDYLSADAPRSAVQGFGREPKTVAPMIGRGAFLEVVATRDGRRLHAEALAVEARPSTDTVWQPLAFLAAVGPAGLVAPLTLTTRSGVEEVDVFYRNYLMRNYRIGERLEPGFYRITVAP